MLHSDGAYQHSIVWTSGKQGEYLETTSYSTSPLLTLDVIKDSAREIKGKEWAVTATMHHEVTHAVTGMAIE